MPDSFLVLVHLVLVFMCNNRQVHFKALIRIVINMMSTGEVLSEGLGADDASGVVDVLHRDVSVVPDVLHLLGS